MDKSSWLQSLVEATQETTTYAPFDSIGSCPYGLGIYYDKVSEPESGIEKVECLSCRKTFFVHIRENFGR
jgi:hypothetical protein